MLQVRVERFGPPSVVAKCQQAPDVAVPSAWEAIVKIIAFPINPADLAMLSGRYGTLPQLPSSIGMEAAGVVVNVGASVEHLQPGDRVMVVANDNWAQVRNVPANLLYKLPTEIDWLTASAMKVNFATAYLLLTDFVSLKKNQWIVQNAPLSNVGRLVIQIASALGLKTLNLVRRPEAVETVLELGGDLAIDSGAELSAQISQQISRSKIKLALDAVGGQATERLAQCCADKATIVTYGMLANESCQIAPEHLVFRQLQHQGFWLSKLLNRITLDQRNQLYNQIASLVVDHGIQPQFDRGFEIRQISEALRFAETGAGKAIVFPNGVPADCPRMEHLMDPSSTRAAAP